MTELASLLDGSIDGVCDLYATSTQAPELTWVQMSPLAPNMCYICNKFGSLCDS